MMSSRLAEPATVPAPLHTKHLRAFAAVSRHGSVARAADDLRRAQSAVSRAIQELERSLDVALFERSSRGLLLTEFGRTLLGRVELAFEELRRARLELMDRHGSAATRLRNAPMFSLAVHERRLQVLIAFAERRHTGDVAQALGVSQPAVSMALRDIEASVGVPLFDRTASGIGLTPAGELLLLHVKRALTQLRIAIAEIDALKGVVEGQVTVGALPFGRPYMLPVAIGRLLVKHPRVRVRTVEGPLSSLVAALRSGDVDFIVGALQASGDTGELVREELFQESMAVIARADHPLAKRRAVSLDDALREAWVLAPRGSPSREALAAALARLGHDEPHVAVESSDLSIIRGLLFETGMISAASGHLFHHELRQGTLVTLPMTLPGTRRTIGILRRTPGHSSPLAQLLIEELRAVRTPAEP